MRMRGGLVIGMLVEEVVVAAAVVDRVAILAAVAEVVLEWATETTVTDVVERDMLLKIARPAIRITVVLIVVLLIIFKKIVRRR